MNKYDYKETVNINNQLVKEFKSIQGVCEYIAKTKHSREVDVLFIEELSELIRSISKLQRFDYCDELLRCNYHDIYDNLYEELGDVIIMMFQFIDKNKISYKGLTDKMTEKIVRYYETKSEEK